MKKFSYYMQSSRMDCGPTCLRMVASFYGKHLSEGDVAALLRVNRYGVSLLGISDTAEKIGFNTLALMLKPQYLNQVDLPVIMHWNNNHFVVLVKIKNGTYYIADPKVGLVKYDESELLRYWLSNDEGEGIILTFSVKESF